MAAAAREAAGMDVDLIFELHRKLTPMHARRPGRRARRVPAAVLRGPDPDRLDHAPGRDREADRSAARQRRADEHDLGVPRPAGGGRPAVRATGPGHRRRHHRLPEDRRARRVLSLGARLAQLPRPAADRRVDPPRRGDPELHHPGVPQARRVAAGTRTPSSRPRSSARAATSWRRRRRASASCSTMRCSTRRRSPTCRGTSRCDSTDRRRWPSDRRAVDDRATTRGRPGQHACGEGRRRHGAAARAAARSSPTSGSASSIARRAGTSRRRRIRRRTAGSSSSSAAPTRSSSAWLAADHRRDHGRGAQPPVRRRAGGRPVRPPDRRRGRLGARHQDGRHDQRLVVRRRRVGARDGPHRPPQRRRAVPGDRHRQGAPSRRRPTSTPRSARTRATSAAS